VRASSRITLVAVWLAFGAPGALAHERPPEGEAHRSAHHAGEQTAPEANAPATAPGHAHKQREAEGTARALAWLGNFHPASAHFPIAMLLGAALAELFAMRTQGEGYGHAARFCVWAGGLGAVAAAALGWCFAGLDIGADDWLLRAHRWLGTATAAWAVLLMALASWRSQRSPVHRSTYLVALFLGAALVAVTGFFGGALVHGLDHYSW
jgi:uncharacterized membrane protein